MACVQVDIWVGTSRCTQPQHAFKWTHTGCASQYKSCQLTTAAVVISPPHGLPPIATKAAKAHSRIGRASGY
eukprot:13068990-Alexandrium_andersonii.AAC.1